MGREWLILSPRCKPGSLAHLFRSFTKQAFSAGICFYYCFCFFLCSFTLGTDSQAQSQSCLFHNQLHFALLCTALASFHRRGGSYFVLGLLDMDQSAIRVVLSQRPAKQQATVTQGGGHTSVTPHRYARQQKGLACAPSNTPNMAFHLLATKAIGQI
ncbi:hypothetical protein GGI43DRAFT_83092 [Trichoderma evansii]